MSSALAQPVDGPPRAPRWRWRGASLVAGLLTGCGFQPVACWPLVFVGIASWLLVARLASTRSTTEAVDGLRAGSRGAAGCGYFFGFGLGLVVLAWLRVLVPGVGPLIAVVLVAFEALFFAVLGVAVALVRRLPLSPVWVGACWGLAEWTWSRVPFGGFGWIRLAYTQVDSPLAGLLPWVGVSGVSAVTAGLAAGLAVLVWRLLPARITGREPRAGSSKPHLRVVVTGVLVVIGVCILGVGAGRLQVEPVEGQGSTTIGMVQGNVDGGPGTEGMGRARSVTNNHVAETVALLARARAGEVAMPDFVLWPENSTDIDPTLDAQTRAQVSTAVQLAERPILVGAVMEGPGEDERQTAGLWWNPDQSISARYDKRNLVPFGEYVPFREQLVPLVPLLSMVGPQSVPGTEPGVLRGRLVDGRELRVGDVICFELAYDRTVREAVAGSQVLVVQSNNATYRGTAQIHQQFAITRARAMEARREIVVATTNSVSGLIDRDGRVVEQTQEMRAASNSYAVPLRAATTPAVRLGGLVDGILNALALGALVWAIVGGVRRGAAQAPRAGRERAAEIPSAD